MNHAWIPATHSEPTPRLEHISGARLLLGDAIIALRLLNETRHRMMAAVFGVSRHDANVLTLFATAALAAALRRSAAAPRTQVSRARSSPTAIGDTMIGTAVVKETLDSIARHPSSDATSAAALIGFALVAGFPRPAIERALRALRRSFRDVKALAHSVRALMRSWGISQ